MGAMSELARQQAEREQIEQGAVVDLLIAVEKAISDLHTASKHPVIGDMIRELQAEVSL